MAIRYKTEAMKMMDDEVTEIRQRKLDIMLAHAKAPAGPVAMTDANADGLLTNGLVLVDFWAPWCGPCRMVAPAVEAVAERFAGRLMVAKLNVDENPGMSMRHRVMSIPTLMVFKDGVPVDKMVGAGSAEQIAAMVGRHMN